MLSFEQKLDDLDTGLFDAIASQTSPEDRTSLLLLQRCVRRDEPYVYLEIGSHLGGTIQPHYADPRCARIYSIDKRPPSQPDQRGREFAYPENSTARMLANLKSALPDRPDGLIVTFDCDASELPAADLAEKPDLCFIDGEHTDAAVCSDFRFCLAACRADGMIAFHDTNYVNRGIRRIEASLKANAIEYRAIMLGGCIYVILLGTAIERHASPLLPHRQNRWVYFRRAQARLLIEHLRNECPLLDDAIKAARWVIKGR